MNKTISSSMTVIYKFIFPSVWISGFGIGTLAMLTTGNDMGWMFLAMWIAGSVFLAWGCFPLKRVQIDGSELLISNYRKTIRVQISQLQDVTENLLSNIHPVWIHFKTTTEFGNRIMFMPTVTFLIFSSHPIVSELKTLSKMNAAAQRASA